MMLTMMLRQRLMQMLEEVVRRPPRDQRLSSTRRRIKLQERLVQVLVHLHDGRLVTTAVAVVGRAEDRDHVHQVRPVISLKHDGHTSSSSFASIT